MDVSPNCDCHAENDIPIVPDIGMLCSEDMVALDQACADLVNAAENCLAHGEKIGLGTREYELIK